MKMGKNQFRQALETLGLSQGQAAEWLGYGLRTVNGWARGEGEIPAPVVMLLRTMLALGLKPGDLEDLAKRGGAVTIGEAAHG